jgi:hypothetical protein
MRDMLVQARKLAIRFTEWAELVKFQAKLSIWHIMSLLAVDAVIAWMWHQTTAYDPTAIPRVKGQRRETRRLLAEKSRQLLEVYRAGEPVAEADCLLQRALGVSRQENGFQKNAPRGE